VPRHRFGADRDACLQDPVLVERQVRNDPGVGVVVEGVGHRVRVHVVVGRELRLDVRDRDVAAEPDHQPVQHLRNEDLAVGHRNVEAVVVVLVQQLAGEQSIRRGVAIVLTVDRRDAEAPVDVVFLNRIRQPLDVDDRLVELHRVGVVAIRRRRVATLDGVVREVAAGVDPAVDLDVVVIHPASDAGIAERGHQRTVDRTRPRHAKAGRAAIGPFGEGIGRNALRRRRPFGAARRRRLGIGGRRVMAPFQPVVVEEALQKRRAEIGVETRIVLVGIDRAPARRWHFSRHVRVGRLRAIKQAHRRERDTCQQSFLHRNRPNFCEIQHSPERLFRVC